MAKIYIVTGTTGEYADRHDWIVGATKSRRIAKSMVKRLNKRLEELGGLPGPGTEKRLLSDSVLWSSIRADMKELDKKFTIDYTGSAYGYEAVGILEGV